MIYSSLDEIPLKVFLKILKTNDTTLLTDDPKLFLKTGEIWTKLKQDFNAIDPDNDMGKLLKTLIKVGKFTAQYNAVKIAVHALRFERDLDLENLVRSQRFKLRNESFSSDLDRVDIEVEAIQLQINEHSKKLPKKPDSSDKAENIDQVILGYSSITNLQYTDTNRITVSQFYALKKLYNQKVEILKEQQENAKRISKK